MTQIDKLMDAPLPKWTYNANRTIAALTCYNALCQAWRGCDGQWIYRVESKGWGEYQDIASSRGQAFKSCIALASQMAREVESFDAYVQEAA
jgi:hypothetical protein